MSTTIETRQHCGKPMRYDVIDNGDVFDGQRLTGIWHCEQCCTMQPTYEPVRSGHDECAFIHKLISGSVRCSTLREHHSQYTGHAFTEPPPPEQPAREGDREWGYADEWRIVDPSDYGYAASIVDSQGVVASTVLRVTAEQVIRDRKLIPELAKALSEAAREIESLTSALEDFHGPSTKQNLALARINNLLSIARKAGVE